MTNPDSTEFALDALPLSPHPLQNFDCFNHIRCPILQPLMNTPPTDCTLFDSGGDLFQIPVNSTGTTGLLKH